jgi:nucleotide-binding universal stress UspA family protein
MSPPSKILIATDLSPASERAVRYGFELARTLHAEVILLYSYAFPGPPNPASFYPAATQAVHDQALEDLRRQAKNYPDVTTRTVVCTGHTVAAIVETTHSLSPELIVTGSHRLKGVEHLLVGSVPETLARKVTCPVLVVPRLPHDAPP